MAWPRRYERVSHPPRGEQGRARVGTPLPTANDVHSEVNVVCRWQSSFTSPLAKARFPPAVPTTERVACIPRHRVGRAMYFETLTVIAHVSLLPNSGSVLRL